MKPTTGVVVGKFYPPHRGHKFLIEFGRSKVDRLLILLCDHPAQEIPAELRARWLWEIHPNCETIITPDDLPEEPGVWAKRTIEEIGYPADFVFSSEDYGPAYAQAMGAEHILVDRARVNVPISATQIRAEPGAYQEFLEPCVRAYFVPRIVIVGAESTGKTTLAENLARHFGGQWVPEYGREFSEIKMPSGEEWTTAEFLHIAQQQQRREDLAARQSKTLLICDTNAWATGTWHERYMDGRDDEVDAVGRLDRGDLYLVPDTNVPFVQDGLRDGEHIRDWMHEKFVSLLNAQGANFRILSGNFDDRFERAKGYCEEILRK